MSLSLCMIVKNEEHNLPRCLESIKDAVDEMIIVDTGSTDATVRIARSFGAKVRHFQWNGNFSDARNFSLKFASGDWILLMDADDEFDSEDKQALPELLSRDDVEAYFFETLSYIGDKPGLDVMKNLNIRLIRNGKGYLFSNPIHEQIYSNIKAINPSANIITVPLKVYHYGYLNKNITGQNKRARNISILEKELEQYPDYGFALFNLGNEYFALGDNQKALEYYEKSYKNFDPLQGFSSKLVLKMTNCLMNLGRYEDALKRIDEGLQQYPEFTDLEYMRGLIYHSLGKHVLSIRHFQRCIRMGEADSYFNVIIGAGTYRSNYLLGEIYFTAEDYETAEEHLRNALAQSPGFSPAFLKLIRTLCRNTTGRKLLKEKLEDLRAIQPDQFDSMTYDILIQEQNYDLALEYIEKHEKASGSSSHSTYSKGLCKLLLKKYRSASAIMEDIKGDPEYLIRAACSQALCKILEEKYPQASRTLKAENIPQDDMIVKVYTAFNNLAWKGTAEVLSDDENESAQYSVIIFDLLKILLVTHEFVLFEKALGLLNTINDKTVLLKLAKLYYNQKSYGLACQEFLRSVKIFDLIDPEGAGMLHKLKLMGL